MAPLVGGVAQFHAVFLDSCTAVTRLNMAYLSRKHAKVGAPPWPSVKLVLAKPDGQLQMTNWEPAGQRSAALHSASPWLPFGSGQPVVSG